MCLSDRFDLANFTQTGMGVLRPKSAVNLALVSNREIFQNPRQHWARPISPYRPHGLLNLATPVRCAQVRIYASAHRADVMKNTELEWTYWTDWTQQVIARVLSFFGGVMAKLNRQEKSELNRVIHKAAQSFAHQASLITIARGRSDMAARLVWRGDVLDVEVLVDQPHDIVADGRDEFEPY